MSPNPEKCFVTFDSIDTDSQLQVSFDWSHPECRKTAIEINEFWSGSDDRLDDAEDVTEEFRDKLAYAAARMILQAAINAAGEDRVYDTARLVAHFAKPNTEGYPELDGRFGITIENWTFTPISVGSYDAEVFYPHGAEA